MRKRLRFDVKWLPRKAAMTAYYNEIDQYATEWLRNLMRAGHIAPGDIDTRSIEDVHPDDLRGYTQCHFFAGIGGWALAASLAGWPDDRELWTGSPPCQPFSVAGKQRGQDDERHLWPHLFRLVSARRPAVLMGEQVAAAVGKNWLDGVFADLEGIGYACGAAVVPACAVDAPHRRDRLWFVAHTASERRHWGENPAGASSGACAEAGGASVANASADIAGARAEWQQRGGELGRAGGDPGACAGGDVANADCIPGRQGDQDAGRRARGSGVGEVPGLGSAWHGAGWIIGHDGKARRVEPRIPMLVDGVSARVGRLRAYGNAIVPQVAEAVIRAYMECRP